MQTTKFDNKFHKNRGDEAINFRPSPNFKHMKKYLKSKFEEDANNAARYLEAEQASSSSDEQEKQSIAPLMAQPPLPPNPPPPDCPLQITLKKEIEDDEYTQQNDENKSQLEEMTDYKTDAAEAGVKPAKTMCRQFIRGDCLRGPTCIYAHELILSQLPGVYTFCKNFQNNGCSFPKCKFIHATVFEKEYFFRTGYLPPHTMAHLNHTMHPPPPPPMPRGPPAPLEPPPLLVFNNPPPPIVHPGGVPVVVTASGAPVVLAPPPIPASASVLASHAPHKREWTSIEPFSGSPRNVDICEPLIKKCKNCDLNEFRLQCNKNKVEKMLRASDEMANKISQLNKKRSRLNTVLFALLDNAISAKSGSPTNHINTHNNRNDKEKDVLDKLNMYFSANNRLSMMGDDAAKNMLMGVGGMSGSGVGSGGVGGGSVGGGGGVNLSSVLVRLLLNAGEGASSDS